MPLVECHLGCLYADPRPYLEGGISHFVVAPSVDYEFHLEYRDRIGRQRPTSAASQWMLNRTQECASFVISSTHQWLFDLTARNGTVKSRHGLGLPLTEEGPAYLGMIRSGKRVFIAEFLDGTATHRRHAYPADHQTNP
jgi:hypothetical protein